MSEAKQRKLWQRVAQHPRSVRFEELRQLLEVSGCTGERVRGSHHAFGRHGEQVVIPPRQPHVPRVYVRDVLARTRPEERSE